MKKGFTMIELIFVIVILGILASVAIPRLAATREDAEISAAAANLRTLVSDINSYYVVKGEFTTGTNGTKWKDITNVPLKTHNNINNLAVGQPGYIEIGGKRCIEVQIDNRIGNFPARITFTKNPTNKNKGVCAKVLESVPVKVYLDSAGLKGLPGTMIIGSDISIYD